MADKEKTLHDRLVAIQTQLKAPKGQYNDFGKYKYRSAEDILEAVKPLLAANDCSLTISDEIVFLGNRYYIKAVATLSDREKAIAVAAYAREDESKKGMDGSQVTGAASSYARKYALNGLFCIDDTKDADATNTHGKTEKYSVDTAIEAVHNCKSPEDLALVWERFSPEFGNDDSFVLAVRNSPMNKA